VTARLAMDVESIRSMEVAFVAIGGGEHEQERAGDRHSLPLELDVLARNIRVARGPGG